MDLWKGFKEFIVWDKVKENEYITSFYLKSAVDEGKLPEYLPGQFVSIRILLENGVYARPRQYTLSCISNGEYYRISVKREEAGDISVILCDDIKKGDKVQCSAPVGKFVLKENSSPVLLIGGGIGITPMLTMAQSTALKEIPTHLIYSVPNSEHYAFEEEIKDLCKKNKNMKVTIVFTRPKSDDIEEKKYQVQGRLSKNWYRDHVDLNSEVYTCGPIEFMRSIYQNLTELGVPPEKVNYELFSGRDDIRKTKVS